VTPLKVIENALDKAIPPCRIGREFSDNGSTSPGLIQVGDVRADPLCLREVHKRDVSTPTVEVHRPKVPVANQLRSRDLEINVRHQLALLVELIATEEMRSLVFDRHSVPERLRTPAT
jgi:hypothetical protein